MADNSSEQLIARFLNYKSIEKGLAPLTIEAYGSDLRQLSQFLSERQLISADRSNVREFVAKLFSDQTQARSVRRKISTFREFFKFLLLDGLIQADPMVKIESPKVGRVLPKALAESEIATVLEGLRPHCKRRPAERMRLRDCALLELLYGSGLRVSELVNARRADVNLIDRYITVRGKGDKQRIAPFGHRAADALREYFTPRSDSSLWTPAKQPAQQSRRICQEPGCETRLGNRNLRGYCMQHLSAWNRPSIMALWLFPGQRGRQLTRARIWQIVGRRFQEIGRSVSPHMLRHSAATHMMEHGANSRVVQEILGHADISTTELYTHVTIDWLKKIYMECHPRSTRKSEQLKLQFDLMPPEILTAAPDLASASDAGDRRRPQKSILSPAQRRVAEARHLMWSKRASLSGVTAAVSRVS